MEGKKNEGGERGRVGAWNRGGGEAVKERKISVRKMRLQPLGSPSTRTNVRFKRKTPFLRGKPLLVTNFGVLQAQFQVLQQRKREKNPTEKQGKGKEQVGMGNETKDQHPTSGSRKKLDEKINRKWDVKRGKGTPIGGKFSSGPCT